MPYNFQNRSDMLAVLEMIRPNVRKSRLPFQGPADTKTLTYGFILKTPSGGISGMTGTTPGKADCKAYFIDSDGELVEWTHADGSSRALTVYHIGEADIGGDRYIQAKRVFGRLVADMEDCPA